MLTDQQLQELLEKYKAFSPHLHMDLPHEEVRELVEEVKRLRKLREKVEAYQEAHDALVHGERDLDTGDLIDDSGVDPQVRANIAEADMFEALDGLSRGPG